MLIVENVLVHPANTLVPVSVADNAIVDVPAFNVRPVMVVQSKTLPVVPASVNVPLPRLSVLVPAPVTLNAVVIVKLGLLAEKSSVPVNAPIVILASDNPLIVPDAVTVPPPELPSKVTESPVVGAAFEVEHPVAPAPVVGAQCVMAALSHVPVPPTQKQLLACACDAISRPSAMRRYLKRFIAAPTECRQSIASRPM